ncbi:MAG TPA: DUF2332 domain-containing protein [Solirubrobacterales bacterium]|nr:DUF2332 domain-containing protein [Solirubrobacterales bacterium]
MTESAQEAIAGQLQWQAEACRMIGSPLYAALLEQAAADVELRGPVWEVLRGHEDDPRFSVLGLRLLGAVNRMVIEGREPELAAAYEARDASRAWQALRDAIERNAAELRSLVDLPVQTNEVGRCNALLFGFLTVAAETGMPLRLLEVGASAGLNLRWDRFAYRADGFSWGPADSPLQLEFELEGKAPALPEAVEVAERRGCDANPVDASTPEGQLTLLSYVWPDQPERIARMRAALAVAGEVAVTVERETASAWTRRVLAEPAPGRATVLYHSIVSQYLSDEEREAFFGHVRAAGERAGADAPLAWLRMEPVDDRADLELTTWPGGETRRLARVGYHGSPVELL